MGRTIGWIVLDVLVTGIAVVAAITSSGAAADHMKELARLFQDVGEKRIAA